MSDSDAALLRGFERQTEEARHRWVHATSQLTCEKAARNAAEIGHVVILSFKGGKFDAREVQSVDKVTEFIPDHLRRR